MMKVEHYYPTNSRLLTEPKFGRAKRIKIWINGELDCAEFIINPKNFRSWISILNHLTVTLQPSFGAIRKLIALSNLDAVDCFEDLDPSDRYVALGASCRLKLPPGGYKEKLTLHLPKSSKKFYEGEFNYRKARFLTESEKKKLMLIYVTVNGRTNQVPQKAVFKDTELRNWDVVLMYLAKILHIPEGVESVCTIFGDILENPRQLQHGYVYVAIPFKECFVCLDYLSLFKNETNFRKFYTLAIRPGHDCLSNKGSPRLKKSTLSTYRLEKNKAQHDEAEPALAKLQTGNNQYRVRSVEAYNKHLQRCSIVRNKAMKEKMRRDVANSIKAFEQRIEEIEKEKLRRSKTCSEIQHCGKQFNQVRCQTEFEFKPIISTKTRDSGCGETIDSGYSTVEKKSLQMQTDVSDILQGTGGTADKGSATVATKQIETIQTNNPEKGTNCNSVSDTSESTITIELTKDIIKNDKGTPASKHSKSSVTSTDSEQAQKCHNCYEFANEYMRNDKCTMFVIQEVTEGPTTSESDTKELLSPDGRRMYSTSSDVSSEGKSTANGSQRNNCIVDRLQALFEKSAQIDVPLIEEEKICLECKSSYCDSLLEGAEYECQDLDFVDDFVEDIPVNFNNTKPKTSDNVKEFQRNRNQTTFGKIAGSNGKQLVNFNYTKAQENRVTSCPTIMFPARDTSSSQTSDHAFRAPSHVTHQSTSKTSSLDVHSGSDMSFKSNCTLKSHRSNGRIDSILDRDNSTASFSVEKYIVQSEDVTMCEISTKNIRPTVIVMKEIERAEFSKMVSTTKIVEITDSLEKLPKRLTIEEV
ncbi:unnamed protein product [Phyllotreta striolata]|uniref:Doublecortin domain-containing protein n=1 Tax=Phyllotreta striolata TaxID=444603 RepID=A0A9N9XT29_PHYSR|nr:unnamed protein product [Phyllotreta striolata]